MKSWPDTGLIDYLAYLQYAVDSQERNSMPARWLCLRDDLRVQFLRVARAQYEDWMREERCAEARRAGVSEEGSLP